MKNKLLFLFGLGLLSLIILRFLKRFSATGQHYPVDIDCGQPPTTPPCNFNSIATVNLTVTYSYSNVIIEDLATTTTIDSGMNVNYNPPGAFSSPPRTLLVPRPSSPNGSGTVTLTLNVKPGFLDGNGSKPVKITIKPKLGTAGRPDKFKTITIY